jgi:hypothetical protein
MSEKLPLRKARIRFVEYANDGNLIIQCVRSIYVEFNIN